MGTTKITIEELAVKLNGKIWTKGDLKRIYLDRGFNTKKMSTKTYVQLSPSGMWDVKCFVECPSQDYNWCKSQANLVIESVEEAIKEILNPSAENISEDEYPEVNVEKLIDTAQEQSGTERKLVSEIIHKMIIAFENDKYNILSRLNGFALYITYNYNCHHAITVVMNDRTKEIGYLHNSGGFLCFTGDDWMGDDTYTNLDVIPQNHFSSIE